MNCISIPSAGAIGAMLLASLGMVTSAAAQTPQAFNRLDFSNRILTDRDDRFPDQATQAGTKQGDGLFKVIPDYVLERHGDHRISGYRMAISYQRSYAFQFGRVSVPEVQVFRTKTATLSDPPIGSKTYDVLDDQKPVSGTFGSFDVNLPNPGAYIVEVELNQVIRVPARVNGTRAGLAILARSKPGQSTTDPNVATAVMRPSYQERHVAPARDAYSGSYTAATGAIKMYGMLGQPSPRGELYLSLLFENPTLSMFGSSAGGDFAQKEETGMGPGAFATDLASARTASTFGFFGQGQQYHVASSTGKFSVIPLIVARTPAGPTQTQRIDGANIRLDPQTARLGALFPLGAWGFLDRYVAGGSAGFVLDKLGAWASQRYVQPALSINPPGDHLWIQGVVVNAKGEFVDTTNVVRVTLN